MGFYGEFMVILWLIYGRFMVSFMVQKILKIAVKSLRDKGKICLKININLWYLFIFLFLNIKYIILYG
jgi:hypothetical protein